MTNLSANQIDPASLQENSIPRRGDGSFETILKEKEKTLLVTPWSQIEKLFNIYKLEFDFNFKPSKIEPDYSQNKGTERQELFPQQKDNANKDTNGLVFEFKNTEVLKDILKKNFSLSPIPYSLTPFFFPGASLNTQAVSKTDMQLVIDEIVKQARLIKTTDRTELSLNLTTRELGDLLLSLSYKNGLLLIQIGANPEAKKILEEHQDELILALKQSNIDLEEMQIKEVNSGQSRKFSG